MNRSGLRIAPGVGAAIMFALMFVIVVPVHGQAAAPQPKHAETPVEVAMELYRQAYFDEAAASLKSGLAEGRVTGDDWAATNELLARSLVRSGNRVGGGQVFRQILERDPSYRPDATRLPADEMEVFEAALAEHREWEVRQRLRAPASISLHYGFGQDMGGDFADLAALAGGTEKFQSSPEFGGSVRFPLGARWSLDVSLTHLEGTNEDALPPSNDDHSAYEIDSLPLAICAVYRVFDASDARVNVIFGGGPLLDASIGINFQHDHPSNDPNDPRLIPVTVFSQKTGIYAQLGAELEYLVQDRLSLFGHAKYRYAKTGVMEFTDPQGLDYSDFEVYANEPYAAESKIGGRELDFSGMAAHFGVRYYVGQ